MSGLSIDALIYRSYFDGWITRATVRTRPERKLAADEDELYCFPPSLFPCVLHPYVQQCGEGTVKRALMQRLHLYLDFTARLEHEAVNPVCAMLANGSAGLTLPSQMIADAYKIYTDEAWHAQFSDAVQRQVIEHSGVAPVLPARQRFLVDLDTAERAASPGVRPLVRTFFALVSETLITAILEDIPHNKSIKTVVRETVADHARDEGVHRAYFSKLLEYAWPQLSRHQRLEVGRLLPGFIRSFLEPDLQSFAAILRDAGLSADHAGQIITDCYTGPDQAAKLQHAARGTVSRFEDVGVLREPATRDLFGQAGLIGI